MFNEADETALLRRFFDHIRELRPNVIVTFNGDFFDWPFVETRARMCVCDCFMFNEHITRCSRGMNMFEEIGVSEYNGEYRGQNLVHLDAFSWVRRDSYLPQGSQGLKVHFSP